MPDREMTLGEASEGDLADILGLYRFLHPGDPVLEMTDALDQLWKRIRDDPNLRYYVAHVDDRLIGTCHLAIIPNLTRGARPYGLIENVITHPDFRERGVGTRLLRTALDAAWERGCYKVMLLTGRKDESIHRFYEKAGFRSGIKTGFVAYPGPEPCGAPSPSAMPDDA